MKSTSTNSEKKSAPGIYLGDISCSLAKNSPTGRLLYADTIAPDATTTIVNDNYRLAKFMRSVFSSGFDELQEVRQDDGDTWYTDVETIDGKEYTFHISKYEIINSISGTPVSSEDEIKDRAKKYNIDAKDSYITIDGKKYFIDLSIPLHYGMYGEGATVLFIATGIVSALSALSAILIPIIKKYGFEAFGDLVKKLVFGDLKAIYLILKNVLNIAWTFISTLVVELIGGADFNVAFAAARTAVEEIEGEGVGMVVAGIDLGETLTGLAGLIAGIAIYLIITFILYKTYQVVTIYNLTNNDLHFSFPYFAHGTPPNSSGLSNLIKSAREIKTKDGHSLGTWYNAAGFLWQSNGYLAGIGYTTKLTLVGAEVSGGKECAAMFDIPHIGDNSLSALITEPSNYKSFYDDNEGVHKETLYTVSDENFELIVTYDYLSGKHPNPETGAKSFLYNTMIIIRNKKK